MTLEEFLAQSGPKYAVLRKDHHEAEPVASERWTAPGTFMVGGIEFVAINLEPYTVPEIVAYIESQGSGVEFEFTVGSGLVSLLSHGQVMQLIASQPVPVE